MDSRTGKSGVIGFALIVFSICILFLYVLSPLSRSEEYKYTILTIYNYSFLPSFCCGLILFYKAYKYKINKILDKLKVSARCAGNFLHRHPTAIKYCLFALIVLVFIIIACLKTAAFSGFVFLSVLPYLCLAGTVWIFRLYNQDKPLFLSIIYGSFLWSAAIFLQINILSWLECINSKVIAYFWLIYFLPVALILIRRRRHWKYPKIEGVDWIPVFIAFFTLLIGFLYPPNNFDVLSYHMSRVAHWLQNGSLAPYYTPMGRQIGMAPLNAYIALQSYAPDRLDYFVNLGQWFAYIGCVIGVRQLAISLGTEAKAQNAAVIFAATLPGAIMQASNTESSLMVSFFLCAMAWLAIIWRKEEQATFLTGILFGMALGFAILCKGSAYPIALPFVLLIAWYCVKHPKKSFAHGALAALIVIVINAPHLCRNYVATGSLVGGSESNILRHPTPQTFIVNTLFNFAVNNPQLLALGGDDALNGFAAKLGINKDDRHIFPWGTFEPALKKFTFQEGYSPNPLHSILLLFIVYAIMFRNFRPPLTYTGAVGLGFILFCLFLTYHPYTARIQISLFLLVAPIAGMYLATLRSSRLRKWILISFCIIASFPLFMCRERPLLSKNIFIYEVGNPGHFLSTSRDITLFNGWSEIALDYIAATEFIAARRPDTAGIMIGADGLEYPFWRILRDRLGNGSPKIVSVISGDRDAPHYVFDYERDWGMVPPYRPRVLEYENGEPRVIFEGSPNDNNNDVP